MKRWKNRFLAAVLVAVIVFSYALQGAAMTGAEDPESAVTEENSAVTMTTDTEPETEITEVTDIGSTNEAGTETTEKPDVGSTNEPGTETAEEADVGGTGAEGTEIVEEPDTADTPASEIEIAEDPDTGSTEAPDTEHAAEEEISETGETEVSDVTDGTMIPSEVSIPPTGAPEKAAPEPNWTSGGSGTKKDVSDKVSITSRQGHYYSYDSRGYGSWNTISYTALMDDSTSVGYTVCMDPRRDGDVVGQTGTKVYEMDAPMLVKALYYGAYGPGKSVVEGITGTSDVGTNNIVTHVAAAEIYARMGYAYKSSVGDGFIDTTSALKEAVKEFVNAIENKPVPGGYYVYVIVYGSSKQDFGFGSTELVSHDASLTIHKDVNESDAEIKARILANTNYSLAGAVYGIYKTRDTAENLRKKTPFKTLTIDKNGNSETCAVESGTYYAVEIAAPTGGGYVMSDNVYEINLSSGEQRTLEVKDNYKFVYLRINKEPKNIPEGTEPPSLEGAVFEIYSNAKCTSEYYVGTLTTGPDGKTEQLKADTDGGRLLIQNYYAKETKAPVGYYSVGKFTIDTGDALERDAWYTLIDRTVQESMIRTGIVIHKESVSPSVTANNPCYSLAGAEFGIYSNAECTGDPIEVLVTDEDGMAESATLLPAADYWIKETKAPKGYLMSEEVFKITSEGIASGVPQEITVQDAYKSDPARITIVKKAANGLKARSLAGTEFTFCYYKGYYSTEDELPRQPERSWTVRTFESNGMFIARIADCVQNGTFVSGDEFYLDQQGNPTFPLGTVTITETKAAEGYENDPDFGDGAGMMIGNVVLNENGDVKFTVLQGRDPVGNSLTVEDTPKEPAIRTSALDARSRSHMAYAGSETIMITDTVSYENLNENTDYTMIGTLMDKEMEAPFTDADGNDVKAAKKFRTGEELTGTVDVEFSFRCDEDSLKGHTLVVKEELVPDESNEDAQNIAGAEHWDPEDKEQTIIFPKIGTSLRENMTGEQLLPENSAVELTDTVTYENLLPGEEYTITGTLMDKATGKPVQINGEDIVSSVSFVPDTADGTVEVSFAFHTGGLGGKNLVAFEKLTCDGRIVARHEDLNDAGQTVSVPGIETDAYDKETGSKSVLAEADRVIVDEVSYNGLIAGETYEISGEIKKKTGSKESFDDAPTIPSKIVAVSGEGSITFDAQKVTFVPEGREGEAVSGILYVSFQIDASELSGEELVVGETVKRNGEEIAVHRDLGDERQTVYVKEVPKPTPVVTPPAEKHKKSSGSPLTGDDSRGTAWLVVLVAATAGIAGAAYFGKKRNRKKPAK